MDALKPITIPKNPSAASRQFNTFVRNLSNTHRFYQENVPHLLTEGNDWYERAQDFANKLSPGNLRMGAGVIAAMSPRKNWDLNQRLAEDMFKRGRAGHVGVQVEKARRILNGEDPEDVLGRLKEGHFFQNIVDPDNPNFVTVDRHAHDAAVNKVYGENDRGLSGIGRYGLFKNAYDTAAGNLGIEVPSRLQAQIWTPWQQGIVPTLRS